MVAGRRLCGVVHLLAEALFAIQSLITQSPEIQKILAFEGAFEKLFNVVLSEQGVEGGVVVADALSCVDGLLRFNQSNHVRSALLSYCGAHLRSGLLTARI